MSQHLKDYRLHGMKSATSVRNHTNVEFRELHKGDLAEFRVVFNVCPTRIVAGGRPRGEELRVNPDVNSCNNANGMNAGHLSEKRETFLTHR